MSLIQYLTDIHFDFGAVAKLKDELRRLAIRSPLIVTDRELFKTDCSTASPRIFPLGGGTNL